ncbi:MAG: tyrosine-type recombinase/integrase [Byssovorax sp.]
MTAALALASFEPLPSLAGLAIETHPALAFLASQLSAKGRRAQASALARVAAALGSTVDALPWHALRYPHVAALRAHLAERLAPATVNRYLAAVRGVLREAARLDLLTAEDCARACSCPGVKGSREPRGRGLDGAELAALLGACDRATPSGVRDAALLGIAYGAGLRRAELVALTLAALDLTTGAIRLIGKGNKERTTYAPAWAVLLVRSWLDVRGHHEGPLFVRIDKAGACDLDGPALSDEAVRFLFARLAGVAGVASFTPHDTRRSCISDLLDAGADISTVQRLAGHASPTVTQRYDRRGERSKRQAAALLRDPSALL